MYMYMCVVYVCTCIVSSGMVGHPVWVVVVCDRATSHREWTTPCHHKSSQGFESNTMVYHAMSTILMLIHLGYLCEYMYSKQ